MRNGFVKSIAVMTSAILLASCAEMEARKAAPAATQTVRTDLRGPFELERLKLLTAGIAPESVTGSENNLRERLDEFSVPDPGGPVGRWIGAIKGADGGRGPEEYKGLGGVQARDMIDVSAQSLNGDNYGGPVVVGVTGQIEKNVTLPDGTVEPGYEYDPATRSGHLWVTMYTEWQRGASVPTHIRAERYKVVVEPTDPTEPMSGFLVEPKKPAMPWNVFPDAAAHTGLQVSSATAAGFQVKLYAAGDDISVEWYWIGNVNPGNGNLTWQHQLQAGQAGIPMEYRKIFEPSDDACIDMMFADTDVPTPHLEPTDAPPYYCLGRCRTPMIINTR